VFACSRCDLWFLSAQIRPNADRENNWYSGMTEMSQGELADLARQMSGPYKRQLQHLSALTSGRDLLDVGCGAGMFLNEAKKDWNAFGLEASAHGRAFAETRLGLCVMESPVQLPVHQFDVVRLSHVLEHIPEPGHFINWICSLLKPGGVLLTIVPNRESLVYWAMNRLALAVSSRPALRTAIYPDMHVLGFSTRSLISLMRRCQDQLTVISVRTVSMGDRIYYPVFYDGLLRVSKLSDVPRRSIIRYYAPLLLANFGNRLGLGDWIVGHFRKPALSGQT
jgi:SAM-dependent methyltransferase